MSHREDPRPDDDSRRLQDLERRLREREAADAARKGRRGHADMGALGAAWRMSLELVVALFVGGGLGLLLDRLFHTAPWIMLVGLGLGFAAGVRNAVRTAYRMQVPPTGRALPNDKDDDA
jgi:ATP synthase protein I